MTNPPIPHVAEFDTDSDFDIDHLRWRQIPDHIILQEPVADDARRRDARLSHYMPFATAIRAQPDEERDVIQTLDLLECTHGAPRITAHLPMLALALATTVEILGRTLTELAAQRHLASAGLLVGALIETEAKVAGEFRRTPEIAVKPRAGSPNVDFEDFLLAARVQAILLDACPDACEVNRETMGNTWRIAEAYATLRQHTGFAIAGEFIFLAECSHHHWSMFILQVDQLFKDHGILRPIAWRAIHRRRRQDGQGRRGSP